MPTVHTGRAPCLWQALSKKEHKNDGLAGADSPEPEDFPAPVQREPPAVKYRQLTPHNDYQRAMHPGISRVSGVSLQGMAPGHQQGERGVTTGDGTQG